MYEEGDKELNCTFALVEEGHVDGHLISIQAAARGQLAKKEARRQREAKLTARRQLSGVRDLVLQRGASAE